MKRPPFGPQPAIGQIIDQQRELNRALDYQDETAPARGLGLPRQGIVVASKRAEYGDLLYLDPTTTAVDGKGIYIYVYLPKGERSRIGEVITVKNYSTSANRIRIQPVNPPDVIDEQAYVEIAVAWGMATVKLIEEDKWICIAQNGCSDCTASCTATCADTCDGNCIGSCKNTDGACTACSGGCDGTSGACAACSGGCDGTAKACADCSTSCYNGSGSCGSCSTSCALGSGACTSCSESCYLGAGSCASCSTGCEGTAKTCVSCSTGCEGTAKDCADCTGGCNTICYDRCMNDCEGTCDRTCELGCYQDCNDTCFRSDTAPE